MATNFDNPQPAQPAEATMDSIARVAAMTIHALRTEWQSVFGSDPPPAFSKDLLARAITYRMQEQTFGGIEPSTARYLRMLQKPGTEPPRRVQVGSVIVREHKGVMHEVLVIPGGFCWQGKTYSSLSTVAKAITGISWNGPRFFGLRSRKEAKTQDHQSSEGIASRDTMSSDGSGAIITPARARGRRSSIVTDVAGASGARL